MFYLAEIPSSRYQNSSGGLPESRADNLDFSEEDLFPVKLAATANSTPFRTKNSLCAELKSSIVSEMWY